ncbi:unnamed protein product, partial [Closterium sp. NIES-54]
NATRAAATPAGSRLAVKVSKGMGGGGWNLYGMVMGNGMRMGMGNDMRMGVRMGVGMGVCMGMGMGMGVGISDLHIPYSCPHHALPHRTPLLTSSASTRPAYAPHPSHAMSLAQPFHTPPPPTPHPCPHPTTPQTPPHLTPPLPTPHLIRVSLARQPSMRPQRPTCASPPHSLTLLLPPLLLPCFLLLPHCRQLPFLPLVNCVGGFGIFP